MEQFGYWLMGISVLIMGFAIFARLTAGSGKVKDAMYNVLLSGVFVFIAGTFMHARATTDGVFDFILHVLGLLCLGAIGVIGIAFVFIFLLVGIGISVTARNKKQATHQVRRR